MTHSRLQLTPGPDHPITLARCPSHVVVRGGSLMIAESDRALEMREASYQPVFYIPLDDVDRLLLGHSDHHTYCPYKGEASYYDILDNNGTELPRGSLVLRRPVPGRCRYQKPRGVLCRSSDRQRRAQPIQRTNRPDRRRRLNGNSGP